MINSDGMVRYNQIKLNARSGVLTAGKTIATLFDNTIEDSSTGVLIKDPPKLPLNKDEQFLPRLRDNKI